MRGRPRKGRPTTRSTAGIHHADGHRNDDASPGQGSTGSENDRTPLGRQHSRFGGQSDAFKRPRLRIDLDRTARSVSVAAGLEIDTLALHDTAPDPLEQVALGRLDSLQVDEPSRPFPCGMHWDALMQTVTSANAMAPEETNRDASRFPRCAARQSGCGPTGDVARRVEDRGRMIDGNKARVPDCKNARSRFGQEDGMRWDSPVTAMPGCHGR